MFKIKANPTFPGSITFVGQGEEQTLNVTFRHMRRAAYNQMMEKVQAGELTTIGALQELLAEWDADAPVTADSLLDLVEERPGADWAILAGYVDALGVARKGN